MELVWSQGVTGWKRWHVFDKSEDPASLSFPNQYRSFCGTLVMDLSEDGVREAPVENKCGHCQNILSGSRARNKKPSVSSLPNSQRPGPLLRSTERARRPSSPAPIPAPPGERTPLEAMNAKVAGMLVKELSPLLREGVELLVQKRVEEQLAVAIRERYSGSPKVLDFLRLMQQKSLVNTWFPQITEVIEAVEEENRKRISRTL